MSGRPRGRPPGPGSLAAAARAQQAQIQQSQAGSSQQQPRHQQRQATRPNLAQPAAIPAGTILAREKLYELLAMVCPNERIEPIVEQALIRMADDFIAELSLEAATLAKHRGSNIVEPKDLYFQLERHWDLGVPGYVQADERTRLAPRPPTEAHLKRTYQAHRASQG